MMIAIIRPVGIRTARLPTTRYPKWIMFQVRVVVKESAPNKSSPAVP